MKRLLLLLISIIPACSYTVTDDARVTELANQLRTQEQRLDATDARVNSQGEAINALRQKSLYK